MSDNMNISGNLSTLFSDLHDLVKTDTVLGQPLPVGEKTLVPVMSVTVGYGATGMGKKVQNEMLKGSSDGLGLGAKVCASSVIVIDKDNVSVLPVNDKSGMNQLMEKVPQALANLGQNIMQQGMQNMNQQGGQNQQNQQNQQSSQSYSQQNQSESTYNNDTFSS